MQQRQSTMSPQADFGYTTAIRLIVIGELTTAWLWRSETFDGFRSAIVDGQPNHEWLEQFVADMNRLSDLKCSASFLDPSSEHYPPFIDHASKTTTVISVSVRDRKSTYTTIIIVSPNIDTVLQPSKRFRSR